MYQPREENRQLPGKLTEASPTDDDRWVGFKLSVNEKKQVSMAYLLHDGSTSPPAMFPQLAQRRRPVNFLSDGPAALPGCESRGRAPLSGACLR